MTQEFTGLDLRLVAMYGPVVLGALLSWTDLVRDEVEAEKRQASDPQFVAALKELSHRAPRGRRRRR